MGILTCVIHLLEVFCGSDLPWSLLLNYCMICSINNPIYCVISSQEKQNITHLKSVIWVNESPYFTNLDLKEISTQTLHQPPISWTKVNFGRIPMYYTTERHPEIWAWGCFQTHSWMTLGVKGDEFWILWFKVIRLFWSRFGLKVSRDDSVKQAVILTNNMYTFL